MCVSWFLLNIFQGGKKKEIAIDEVPSRGFMWRKGREDKNGEFNSPVLKNLADQLVSLNSS